MENRDVLTQRAEEEELDGEAQEKADAEGRDSHGDPASVGEFVQDIGERDKEAQNRSWTLPASRSAGGIRSAPT